jgi:hypothetical protein
VGFGFEMDIRWTKSAVAIALWAAATPHFVYAQNKTAYDYVDPLIGTINGGELRNYEIFAPNLGIGN